MPYPGIQTTAAPTLQQLALSTLLKRTTLISKLSYVYGVFWRILLLYSR